MAAAACLSFLANGTTAEAFTYPEHVVITNAALAHANRVDGPATKLALSALQAFVQPEGKRSWPLDVELGRGLPPATFHAADLVALAADHSTTPINLLVRWFWWYDAGSRCSCSNAIDAILSLDNSAEPPTVCMGGTASGRFAVDRAGFLETVRAYHDARGVLKSTSGIDLKLAAHDCAYTCMAERGRTHFRIPTLTIEDASYRHDYPNAASSYAMNHAIAIGLAMMSAGPEPGADAYLGLAMVYEAFALHYLQDGIAPGHIVSSHHGYGNITVNGTHDHYNREGIVVSLSEGLCQQAAQMPLPHAFSNLRSQCLTPPEQRSPRLYGDHAMANKLGGGKGDVTADVAELLTLASLLEVIRAPRHPEWVREERRRGNRFDAFLAKRFEAASQGRPELREDVRGDASQQMARAAPPPQSGAGSAATVDETLVEATRKVDTEWQQLSALLHSQRGHFAKEATAASPTFARLGAAGMWPTATVPQPLIEAPGGNNFYIPFLIRNGALFDNNDLVGSLGVGWAYMASLLRRRFVFGVSPFVSYSSARVDDGASRWGGGLWVDAHVHWLTFGGLSLLNGIHFAGEVISRAAIGANEQHAIQVSASLSPFSYEMMSDLKSFHIGPVAGLGYIAGREGQSGDVLGFLGLALSATYHPARTTAPLPEHD